MLFSAFLLGQVVIAQTILVDSNQRIRQLEERVAALEAAKQPASAPVTVPPLDVREPPFGRFDASWMNGSNRQPSSLLALGPVTLSLYVDMFYAWQLQAPVDHTIFESTVAPRHNEVAVNLAAIGIDLTGLDGPTGRLYIQYGTNVETVYGQDRTSRRGYFLSSVPFLQQIGAGWHFHWFHGVNLELGIFPSYIGLESYLPQENWNYTKQFISDFTPYYLAGLRAQLYFTDRMKLELWLVNGWQTFSQWHEARAGGYFFNFRPNEAVSLVNAAYFGQDVQNDPHGVRYYSDNNLQLRYYKGEHIKSAAVSLVFDIGYEQRSTAPSGLMTGAGLAHRVDWTRMWATAVRGDIYYDKTQALIAPLPVGSPYALPSSGAFLGGGITVTMDFMPSPWVVFRAEYAHRQTNIPYLSGHGGISGPGGVAAAEQSSFKPDLRKSDDRFVLNATVRL